MMIKYNKVNLHVLASYDGKDIQWMRPGWNEFPKHIWDAHKDDAEIKQMLASGVIQLMEEKVETKLPSGKKATKVIGATDDPIVLKDLEEAKAIAIIQSTFNREILQRWMDEESRSKVKRALDKQLAPLVGAPADETV